MFFLDLFFIYPTQNAGKNTEVHSELSQTSKMNLFAEKVDG